MLDERMTLDARHARVESVRGMMMTSRFKKNNAYRLLVNVGWVGDCRRSQPFILRSSPPDECMKRSIFC